MTGTTRSAQMTIVPIVPPESLDSGAAQRFVDLVQLGNAVARHESGHGDLDQEPAEALGYWHDQTDRSTIGFAAVRDETLVGAVTVTLPNEEHAFTAEFELLVHPGRWGEGVEDALIERAESEARRRSRSVLQTWTLHRPDPDGARLRPSTGWGSIPREDRQTAVMLEHGFTLEQVERNSAFELHESFDHLERMLADAQRIAGADYRTVSWLGATPAAYVESYADVLARLITDMPAGGMAFDVEQWDADRVRRRDARMAEQRLLVSVVAVQHVPTGRLVAYNELAIGEDRTAATQQYGTLVVAEHRGRRLGTIVKCVNLQVWRDLVPHSPRVTTFNAEENRPMLDVNEAIGFVPRSYAGAWKKELA